MDTSCERWNGTHRKEDGRPVLVISGRWRYVYRVRWEEIHGPLDSAVSLHHKCLNRWCINVEHLEPMLQSDHLREHGLQGDWGQAEKTHCPSGHEYSEENTYIYSRKNGTTERHCRKCRQVHKKAYRERVKLRNTRQPEDSPESAG